jgi:hypothetical protein
VVDFNIRFSIEFGAEKSLAMTVKRFMENKNAERVEQELQLLQTKAANEMFTRVESQIKSLVQKRIKDIAFTVIGNVLVATEQNDEVHVGRTDKQAEPFVFKFDSFERVITVTYGGRYPCARVIKVVVGKPHLEYQRRPDELFTPISVNNLPAIVNHSIDNLLDMVND